MVHSFLSHHRITIYTNSWGQTLSRVKAYSLMFLLGLVELKEHLDLLVMEFPHKPSRVCSSPVIIEQFNVIKEQFTNSGYPFPCKNICLHGLCLSEYEHVIIYWKKMTWWYIAFVSSNLNSTLMFQCFNKL